MKTSVLLGYEVGTDREVRLSYEARKLGTYIIGTQGFGKSNLVKQIVLADIENGDGVCFLSPHPDGIQDVLERIPSHRRGDVIVYDPKSDPIIGMNVFEWKEESGVTVGQIADEVVTKTFRLLWGDSWGPQMEQTMRNTARTIVYAQCVPEAHRPTLAEFAEVVGLKPNNRYRKFLESHIRRNYQSVPVDAIFKFWGEFDTRKDQEPFARPTLNKASLFREEEDLAYTIGQSSNVLDLNAIMRDGKILLVDLNAGRLGKGLVEIIGSLFVGRLFIAALKRELNPTPQFHIIADEFKYFATAAFAELQQEARKFGVDVLVAHQERAQLSDETRSSTKTARNRIVFAVNEDDAKELAGGFSSEPPQAKVTGDREPLGYALYPFDALKRKSHENPEVVDLVYKLSKLMVYDVYTDEYWLLGLLEYTLSGLVSDPEYWKLLCCMVGRQHVELWMFQDAQEVKHFEEGLNQVLYKLMVEGWNLDTIRALALLCDTLCTKRKYPYGLENYVLGKGEYGWTEGEIWLDVGFNHSLFDGDFGETYLRGIAEGIKNSSEPEEAIRRGANDIVRLAFRKYILEMIGDLGKLLHREPVWASGGGQPEPQYEHPRGFSDVEMERKNTLTQLEQYLAWVRIQEREGEGYKTYKIKPERLPKAPRDGAERARGIRQVSAERYGVPRAEVDRMMRERIQIPDDDDSPTDQKPNPADDPGSKGYT